MKLLKILLFTLITAPCFSQVTYTIERLKPDSIFLTETIISPIQGSPRQQEISTSVLLKSESDLQKVLDGLISEGEKAAQEFQQIQARTQMILNKANAAKKAKQ